jgi:hypothetical protein
MNQMNLRYHLIVINRLYPQYLLIQKMLKNQLLHSILSYQPHLKYRLNLYYLSYQMYQKIYSNQIGH